MKKTHVGSKVWTVRVNSKRTGINLESYMILARSAEEASRKGSKLGTATWGRDAQVASTEYEGTLDA